MMKAVVLALAFASASSFSLQMAVKPAAVPAKAAAAKPVAKVAAKPAVSAKPVAKASPAAKPAVKAAAPAAKPAVKAAAKPAAKPAVKAAAPAAKPVVKAAVKPVAKPAAKPVVKAAAKPAANPAAKPVVKASAGGYADALGAQAPLGFYDPLGLVTNVDQTRFDRLRGVELKHGRIAMLAFLGHVTTSNGVHFGGYLDKASGLTFADVKPGLAAFENFPALGTLQIVLFIGWLEAFVMKDVTGNAEFPGDFRNGFDFGWDKFDEDTKLKKRAIELNNGRAAQMGILGLMVHEVIGPSPYIFA